MKYIVYCTAALVICFIVALLITKVVLKKLKRKTGKAKIAFTTIVVCMALYCLVALGYLSVYYHADMTAVNESFSLLKPVNAENFNDKNYDVWMVGGHSMGGIVAAQYAANHSDIIDGIVLLASYSTASLPENISLCSIYGNNDGCLDLEQYETNKVNLPTATEEYIIDGGNHAQFASYGAQKGDGIATISPDTQVQKTAEIICNFAKKIR